MPHMAAEGVEQKALGLVDEMDDPSPGHLSEHPQALSATTTTTPTPMPTTTPTRPMAVTTKSLQGSLQERFVKAKTSHEGVEEGAAESPGGSGSVTAEETKKA